MRFRSFAAKASVAPCLAPALGARLPAGQGRRRADADADKIPPLHAGFEMLSNMDPAAPNRMSKVYQTKLGRVRSVSRSKPATFL